jgi:hypothetical protein
MYERRWGLIAGVVVAVVLVGAIGWFAGRSSAPDTAKADSAGGASGAIRVVDGVPIGVDHSRPGALAAADNYLAVTSETVVQDPPRFEALVRRVFVPGYQAKALREGQDARTAAQDAVANYDAGGRALAIIAARRLDTYNDDRAVVTTWRSGILWGPDERPAARWFLSETELRWDGQRWLVQKMDDARRPAPSPILKYRDAEATRTAAFERELRGMTAPTYGVAR